MSVKYIGLNPQDISIETKNSHVTYTELGPIEYSGLTADGRMVAGVAPSASTVVDIAVDPILSWTVPGHMTLEEASTVPVPYSMVGIRCARARACNYDIVTFHSSRRRRHTLVLHRFSAAPSPIVISDSERAERSRGFTVMFIHFFSFVFPDTDFGTRYIFVEYQQHWFTDLETFSKTNSSLVQNL